MVVGAVTVGAYPSCTCPSMKTVEPRILSHISRTRSWVLSSLAALALGASSLFAQTPDQIEFFEKKVRPILAANCQACHGSQLKTAELDLSSAAGFVQGGQSGPLVSPDEPSESRLLKVIGYEEKLKMPPTGKLKEHEIAGLTEWVEMGAPWPGAAEILANQPKNKNKNQTPEFTEEQKNFWAFQPMRDPGLPKVADNGWERSPIDRFILAKLEEKGIQPSPPAGKMTLLRRASFDLTGLPPSEQELDAFLADDSPGAFKKVVNRLLDSPRYGEHWGRHWLDVARYADSTGNDEDHRYPHAWRYRDYVVQAFNDDMPYDQFVREQIAGDLLPADNPDGINRRGIVATGLLALGPKAVAQQDKKKMLYDVYDEQLDVVSKAFMGLTVTCARCHDHKFDPILQKDYYALTGIFASTRSFSDSQTHVSKLLFKPLVEQRVYERYKDHQDRLFYARFGVEDVLAAGVDKHNDSVYPRLKDYMMSAWRIIEDGASVAALAKQKQLDEAALSRWAGYLTPSENSPKQLEDWRLAGMGDLEKIAAAYQSRFDEQTEEWRKDLEKWRETVKRMVKEANMPPPRKPRFREGRDAFYHDVVFKEGGPFYLSEEQQEETLASESREKLDGLRAGLKHLEETAPPEPPMACAVEEGEIVDQKLFIRGDHHNPGEDVPKGFPAILGGRNEPPITEGSGRLALANWLARPDHPLTARVMVNRIWQWHFGEGIVSTPSNFGATGARPTHPELLDFLAQHFVRSGWSVKAMHRLIMLSSAYQASSSITDEQNRLDPENELLSHFNRRRLNVEEIHDGLLAMEGNLDLTMGGTLQEGVGTDGENSSKRLSVNPDEVTRRMIYIPLRRSNLPTLLNLFDFGDATTTMGKRSQTNVAPQALFMMNSEFVTERARNLAQRLLDDETLSDSRRVERAYRITLNRQADPGEIDSALTYVSNMQDKFQDSFSSADAWQSFCRILLASNDFIYVD